MSWSFHSIGYPGAVAAKATADMTQSANSCSDPEKSLITGALGMIVAALAVFPDKMPVRVSGNGSQNVARLAKAAVAAVPGVPGVAADPTATPPVEAVAEIPAVAAQDAVPAVVINQFKLEIEPIYGFVE